MTSIDILPALKDGDSLSEAAVGHHQRLLNSMWNNNEHPIDRLPAML